jgi:YesN/AraC family two-component response regulator
MNSQRTPPTKEHTDEQFRLIIVEDDFVIYKTLKFIITKHFPMIRIVGHCESVEEVVTLVGMEKPDIVLLDIQLRGGTSFQALETLQNEEFAIIVMSAQADFYFAQEAMKFGASKYLVKPFEPEQMLEALEYVIAKRRRKTQAQHANTTPQNYAAASSTTAIPVADTIEIATNNEIAMKTPQKTLRALIVDTEKSQRATLQRQLNKLFPEQIAIVGEASSVQSAISLIQNSAPDIVFLDVDITNGVGFDVINAFPEPAFQLVFVTRFYGPYRERNICKKTSKSVKNLANISAFFENYSIDL